MRVCWEDCLEDSALRNALPRLPVSLLTCMALPDPLGPAPEVSAPQHPSLLTFQCVRAAGARMPQACLQGSAPRPFPRCHGQEPAGLSAVPKPRSSLSYKTERTWKLKQEKP